MSGFASSLKMHTAFTPPGNQYIMEEESAGKAGRYLGIIAAIFVPYAAPALFGAIAGSGVLGSGLAAAAQAGTIGTLTNTLGSAVVGGLMNAGVAYASGARGAAVWQAAGMGALQGGGGALARAGQAARGIAGGVQAGTQTGASLAGGGASTPAGLVVPGTTASGGVSVPGFGGGMIEVGGGASNSGGLLGAITQRVPGLSGMDLNRMGAAIINAAVNGQKMAGMDDLVAQQREELQQLAATNQAAYNARIAEAQKIIGQADRMDPAWRGRIAMADVQGAESKAADQTMRNIATKQGGSLDAGQRKAYERGAALHTARSKSLAYNRAFKDAEVAQSQMRATGAGLMGPDQFGFQLQQAGQDLEAARLRERGNLMADTAGAFGSALFGNAFAPATSPDPSANYDDEQDSNGGFSFGSFGNS